MKDPPVPFESIAFYPMLISTRGSVQQLVLPDFSFCPLTAAESGGRFGLNMASRAAVKGNPPASMALAESCISGHSGPQKI